MPEQLSVPFALLTLTFHRSEVLVHLQEVPPHEDIVSDPHLSEVISAL